MPPPITSPLELPGYAAAVAREQFLRDAAFLELNEDIAGFAVRPLTLRVFLALRSIRSPLLTPGRTPTPFDLAAFLWLLAPEYRRDDAAARARFLQRCRPFLPPREGLFAWFGRCVLAPPPPLPAAAGRLRVALRVLDVLLSHWLRWWHRRQVERSARALTRAAQVLVAAREYLAEAMADKPALVDRGGVDAPDYYSDACAIISALAREKSFSPAEVLDRPMKVLFQHLREQRDCQNHQLPPVERLPLGNPSDRVIDAYLRGQPRNN